MDHLDLVAYGLAILAVTITALLAIHWPGRRRYAALSVLLIAGILLGGGLWQAVRPSHQSGASSLPVRNGHVIWYGGVYDARNITPQMLQNASAAFDGFVVQQIHGNKDNLKAGESLSWYALDKNKHYTLDQTDPNGDYIGDTLDVYKALPATPMADRYLLINLSPYYMKTVMGFDWTDDAYWDKVVANVLTAAQFAQEAHFKGIFLDTETYDTTDDFYTYASLVRNDPRYQGTNAIAFSQALATAEQRGGQLIQAINQYLPTTEVYISMSYTRISQHVTRANLASTRDSLLVGMLDGLLHNSTPTTTFIDGFEQSYWHGDGAGYFPAWADVIKGTNGSNYNIAFQKYPAQYKAQYKAGFGIDTARDGVSGDTGDYAYCGGGPNQTQANVYYSPQRLAYTVQQAMAASDGYVWVWSNAQNYWAAPTDAPQAAVPRIYRDALRVGAQHGNDPNLGQLPPNSSTAPLSLACRKSATVSLSLSLANRPSNGQSTVTVRALDASGATVASTTATSGSDGALTLSDPSFTDKLDTFGTYALSVAPLGYLPQKISSVSSLFTSPPVSTAQPFTPGDFNGDGRIGLDDLTTGIRGYNGSKDAAVQAAYPTALSLSDLTTLIRNYNTQ